MDVVVVLLSAVLFALTIGVMRVAGRR